MMINLNFSKLRAILTGPDPKEFAALYQKYYYNRCDMEVIAAGYYIDPITFNWNTFWDELSAKDAVNVDLWKQLEPYVRQDQRESHVKSMHKIAKDVQRQASIQLRRQPLKSVPSLVRPTAKDGTSKRSFDVFISYASEEKESVARPLAESLRAAHLDVWFDEFEMRIGDSLRRRIDHGISVSRFGIVILSPSFLGKGWTNYELDGIFVKSVNGEQILLPIWHRLSAKEVMAFSPTLADRVARDTSIQTIYQISADIVSVIGRSSSSGGAVDA